MKDRNARVAIRLLREQIDYLANEIALMKHPHPKDCRCNHCRGYVSDPFTIIIPAAEEVFKEA